ncbi:MAG: PEP-CTERM sorting domain-containing protein [Planctomycetaceae bacterium]|nr:PEP-CTERM sorting domain-containing protein [Planctomycetaceae bacterium]
MNVLSMRQYFAWAVSCVLPLLVVQAVSADTIYEAAIKSLGPTYFYQLNEPDAEGGVHDTMGNAAPGSYNGDYDDGFPEAGCEGPLFTNEGLDGDDEFEYEEVAIPGVGGEGNLAHCSNNEGHIILGPSENYGASAMTVSLFFRADFAQGGDRLFTNNLIDEETSFQVNVANEGLVIAVNPNEAGEFAERTLFTIDDALPDRALIKAEYGWFHVVASTSGAPDERAENIQVWINGEERTDNLMITEWGWGVNTDDAKIGGRHADPLATTTHSGAQDEVAIWLDRVLTEDEVQTIWNAAQGNFTPSNPGDFNGDSVLDAADIDLLTAEIVAGNNSAEFDLNADNLVNVADHSVWVEDLKNTWLGDANLDGLFDSSDFVVAFQAGQYESGNPAGWAAGDWNADQLFDSSDFVAAFQSGAYENGPRPAAAAVPEPSTIVLLGLAMLIGLPRRRRS